MSNSNEFRKVEKIFRPRARIMELLGEQLIKNHTLALFELIKNSYDADANKVALTLVNIDQDNGEIEVEDDGTGMDIDTLINVWMEPANGHRGESRLNGIRTEKGRFPVGEKGVGRFAVHRLGRDIELVTRAKGKPEVTIKINWPDIESHVYLDEADIRIEEREAIVFKDDKHGTRITISSLKQKWRRGEIRKLYKAVLGMTSTSLADTLKTRPDNLEKKQNIEKGDDDFQVVFEIEPEKQWLEGLFDPNSAYDQSMFRLNFELNDDGLTYEYAFKPLEAIKSDYPGIVEDRHPSKVERKHSEFFIKKPPSDESWSKRGKRTHRPLLSKSPNHEEGLGIGPLTGTIIAFDLDREIKDRYLKDEMSGLADFLKEQGGVRVYRDGLRVYSYGEPGDDWLGLDHRRIQSPASKLSNQLILGEVHLNIADSVELREKTNREGFIENEAYNELRYAILCILTEFEAERSKDKRTLRAALSVPPGSGSNKIRKKKSTDELLNDLQVLVLEKKLEPSIGELVSQVSKSYRETRDVLLSAAGAGMGLVTVFHELERGVRNLHQSIENGIPIDNLKEQSKGLISLLRGAMYMVSKSKMEKLAASKLVTYACITQEFRFRHHSIKFLNGFDNLLEQDFEINGMRRMLTATLVNLIDNAIHWTSQSNSDEKFLWIGPSHDLDGPAIIIADNGPGLLDSPEDLVQPFFSRKSEGMGIGLYYSDMIMKSHGGRLAFPERGAVEVPTVCDGAIIALVFKGKENAA